MSVKPMLVAAILLAAALPLPVPDRAEAGNANQQVCQLGFGENN